jgi:hypothetical protein
VSRRRPAREPGRADNAPGLGTDDASGRRTVVGAATVAVLALALAFAGWEGTQPRDSAASHAGVAASIVVVLTAGLVAGRGRQHAPSARWAHRSLRTLVGLRTRAEGSRGVTIWALVVVAVVGWDIASFVAQSPDLPTLSYLVGTVTHSPWGRGAVFAGWLIVGSGLALGHRTRRT